jgi:hypothetical protein
MTGLVAVHASIRAASQRLHVAPWHTKRRCPPSALFCAALLLLLLLALLLLPPLPSRPLGPPETSLWRASILGPFSRSWAPTWRNRRVAHMARKPCGNPKLVSKAVSHAASVAAVGMGSGGPLALPHEMTPLSSGTACWGWAACRKAGAHLQRQCAVLQC